MYEPHEYCLIFHEMPPDQFRRLSEDIKRNGLYHEITLYEGKILDGRHRYRACIEQNIEPRFRTYDGTDPGGFVVSENLARRHDTPSQLAMAGTRLVEVESERAKARQIALAGTRHTLGPDGPKVADESGKTVEIIGKKLGIGATTMRRAMKVKSKGTEEVIHAVESGAITVNEAERIVELRPHSQRRVVSIKDKGERAKELGTTLRQKRTKESTRQATTETRGDALVPGTPYVKRFLGRAEQMLNDLVSECRSEEPTLLAERFLREMDWNSEPLRIQLAYCERLFVAISIVADRITDSRAA